MKSKRSHRKQKPQGNEKEPFFPTRNPGGTKDTRPFFQAKLDISPANDPAEKEADEVANEIVDAPTPQNQAPAGINRKEKLSRQPQEEEEPAQAKRIQRQEEEEMQAKQIQKQEEEEEAMQAKRIQKQEEEEETMQAKRIQKQEEEEEEAQPKRIQKQEEEEEMQAKRIQKQEEEEMQAKRIPTLQAKPPKNSNPEQGAEAAPPSFEQKLEQTKGQGFALPDDLRIELEEKFGARLKAVRIHTDTEAIALCQAIQAQAFTHGYHIYFNLGKYQPHTTEGMRLLAHELTHVVQQNGR